MFKGKKSIYILLPLNVLIWGYMAYKIYTALNEDEAVAITEAALPQPKLKIDDSAAYILRLNYKDPFLKQDVRPRYPAANALAAPQPQPVKPKALPAVEQKTTTIQYLGLIENKTNGSTAAMLLINGSSQIIKPGQAIEDMVFQSITADYIIVKKGKEKLTIRK